MPTPSDSATTLHTQPLPHPDPSHPPLDASLRWTTFCLQLARELLSEPPPPGLFPAPLRWLSAASRSGRLASRLWDRAGALSVPAPESVYSTDGLDPEWEAAPPVLSKWILAHATDVAQRRQRTQSPLRVIKARVGEHTVGWIRNAETQALERGPYIRASRWRTTLEALGDAVWDRIGHDHVELVKAGLMPTPDLSPHTKAPSTRILEERLRRFASAHVGRTVLLVGPAGAGKTTAATQVIRELGSRSLRIAVDSLATALEDPSRWRGEVNYDPSFNFTAAITCLRPEAVLFDDLDRLDDVSRVTPMLEHARSRAPLVVATATYDNPVLETLIRRGRFDDVLEVNPPDAEALANVLGPHSDLAPRVLHWPIAWVAELALRCDVLGRASADQEVENLENRVQRLAAGAPFQARRVVGFVADAHG